MITTNDIGAIAILAMLALMCISSLLMGSDE